VWKKTKDFLFFIFLRFVIYFIFRLISTATKPPPHYTRYY
jgi:hypothetical protein